MSFRGSPLGPLDYIRQMDRQIRDLRANAGTTRVPSQRIGDYIVEIDDSSGDPLIKLTEVATGLVTYCCQPDVPGVDDCPEIPPFTWYGPVDMVATFPGYPVPFTMTIVEAAVVQRTGVDNLVIEWYVNEGFGGSFIAANTYRQRYTIGPQILGVNDVISLKVADFGSGSAEDVVIVLRTCPTPNVSIFV